MKPKNTSKLQAELAQSGSLSAFLLNNERSFNNDSGQEYIKELIDRSGISKATLARCSGMSEIYVHQILSGRRSPSRGRLICLCYGLGATLDEAQELLKLYGLAQLYPRNRRDAILIYGLTHNVSVQDINDRLFAEDEETLY